MKASKSSNVQMAFNIKFGGEGKPVPEICRKMGINKAVYFNWT